MKRKYIFSGSSIINRVSSKRCRGAMITDQESNLLLNLRPNELLLEILTYLRNFDLGIVSVSNLELHRLIRPMLKYNINFNGSSSKIIKQRILPRLDMSMVSVILSDSAEDSVLFNGARYVNFSMNLNLVKLQNLHSARVLNLSYCTNLVDISCLLSIERLNLSNCRGIQDFSPLTMSNLRKVNLSNTTIETLDTLLPSIEELILMSCPRLHDISNLQTLGPNLSRFYLVGCRMIPDLSPLKYIQSGLVVLEDIDTLVDISFLQVSINKLILGGCLNLNPVLPRNLGKIKSLVIHECYNITDITGLGECNLDVDIRHAPHLRDISSLRHVSKIRLVSLNQVEDISFFTGQYQSLFDITSCNSIRDIESLATVPEIIIADCLGIVNVDALLTSKQINTLYISYCDNLRYGNSSIDSNIDCCSIKSLTILCCPYFYNLTNNVVNSIPSISISRCSGITSLQSIFGTSSSSINVINLELSSCYNIIDISLLRNMTCIQALDLSGCKNITDISAISSLPNLRILNLQNCTSIIDVSPILSTSLQKVNLSRCCNIQDITPLRNIYDLDLSYCTQLSDINCLRNVHKLSLSYCESVRDVFELSSVSELNLSYCIRITDVSMLDGVDKLVLTGCNSNLKLPKCKFLINTKGKNIYNYL